MSDGEGPARARGIDAVRGVAYDLHEALVATPLPLPLPDTELLRARRSRLLDQLEDHVLPRLADPDRPILVVVGGPTGVGKSTLVNTLVGRPVTNTGIARPTTRSPVLIHHPDDASWFGSDGILPAFKRVERSSNDPDELELVAATALPPGVALLDAPDFDSIDDDNRVLATRLLAAADAWLFVTSAARYADEVPWLQLDVAKKRRTPLMVVMNRIQPEDLTTVSTDFSRQLDKRGLRLLPVGPGRGDVMLVQHGEVDGARLASSKVAAITAALSDLSAPRLRQRIAWESIAGTLREAAADARDLGAEARHQVEATRELIATASDAYAASLAALLTSATDGTLVRGNLLAHWREFIGVNEPLPMADMLRLANEARQGARGAEQDAQIGRLELAIDLALESLITEHAEQAADAASRQLRATWYGDAMLGWSDEDLTRPSRRLGATLRRSIAEWRKALTRAVFDLSDGDTADSRGLVVGLAVCALGTPRHDQEARNTPGLVVTARHRLEAMITGLMRSERDRYRGPASRESLALDAPDRLRGIADRLTAVVDWAGPRG